MKSIIKKSLKKMGKFVRNSNIPFETPFVKILMRSRLQRIVALTPINVASLIELLFPSLGLAMLVSHAKYNLSFYHYWYKLTVSIENNIFKKIRERKKVDIELFNFTLVGISSPALLYNFFQLYGELNDDQKLVLRNRVKTLLRELTPINATLFSKQFLFLSSNDGTSKWSIEQTVELLNSFETEYQCTINEFPKTFLKADHPESTELKLSKVFLDQSNKFLESKNVYFPLQVSLGKKEDFYNYNCFKVVNKNEWILLRKIESEQVVSLAEAFIFIGEKNEDLNKFLKLKMYLEGLSSIQHVSSGNVILLDCKSDFHLQDFLKKAFPHFTFYYDDKCFNIEVLTIIILKRLNGRISPAVLDSFKYSESNFKDKVVILTNSFNGMPISDYELLKSFSKSCNCTFLDVEITPYIDIINAWKNAAMIITGSHPVSELLVIRQKSLPTYILKKSGQTLDAASDFVYCFESLESLLEKSLNHE